MTTPTNILAAITATHYANVAARREGYIWKGGEWVAYYFSRDIEAGNVPAAHFVAARQWAALGKAKREAAAETFATATQVQRHAWRNT